MYTVYKEAVLLCRTHSAVLISTSIFDSYTAVNLEVAGHVTMQV